MGPFRWAWRSASVAKASKMPKVVGDSRRANQMGVVTSGSEKVCQGLLLARLGFQLGEQCVFDHVGSPGAVREVRAVGDTLQTGRPEKYCPD
jgi:hypothetical protein